MQRLLDTLLAIAKKVVSILKLKPLFQLLSKKEKMWWEVPIHYESPLLVCKLLKFHAYLFDKYCQRRLYYKLQEF
jgi:hypothetical protein